MAFYSTDDLKEILPKRINPYREERVKNASYELALGDEVYLTSSQSGKKEVLDNKNCQVVIEPGQFAILLTEEKISIPEEMIAFISIKFREKKKGLVNISGFHVDPGFNGKIKFSVYNAGPARIVLDKGQVCFLIWFSELKSKAENYNGDHQGQNNINANDVEMLKGTLASPNILLDRLNSNDHKLERILWVAAIFIALGSAILAKLYTDKSGVKDAYEAGLKERLAKEEVQDAVKQSFVDSLVTEKVDSILLTRHFRIDSTGAANNK